MLGEHLGDILEDEWCLREVLPALPTEIKACLLAVARLRRLLSDAALAALADAGQAVLDLHGTGAHVSDAGVRAALRAMPQLRRVDLSSCPVGADTLRALGESCPRVEVLRLGSPATDAGTGRCAAVESVVCACAVVIIGVPGMRKSVPLQVVHLGSLGGGMRGTHGLMAGMLSRVNGLPLLLKALLLPMFFLQTPSSKPCAPGQQPRWEPASHKPLPFPPPPQPAGAS